MVSDVVSFLWSAQVSRTAIKENALLPKTICLLVSSTFSICYRQNETKFAFRANSTIDDCIWVEYKSTDSVVPGVILGIVNTLVVDRFHENFD